MNLTPKVGRNVAHQDRVGGRITVVPGNYSLSLFDPNGHGRLRVRNITSASAITIFTKTRNLTGNLSTMLGTTTILGIHKEGSVGFIFINGNGLGPILIRHTGTRGLSGYVFLSCVPGTRLDGVVYSTSINVRVLTGVPTFCCNASPGGFFSCVATNHPMVGGCLN